MASPHPEEENKEKDLDEQLDQAPEEVENNIRAHAENLNFELPSVPDPRKKNT